ncbi:enoyl-CoA hydratase/isomerase family protein [Desulfopila inferna]|uniref:enoyl-CoA hydratase/isomerase family protein n=1 Tax=Desulfopila inferna TaxID=468528 RepID=UPI001962BA71|nr:enoyl-CoA hydratase/isomerase family protein [Desulfopila inferna]
MATLSAEKNLNAINLDMIDGLYRQLQDWRHNEHIACVWLQGLVTRRFVLAEISSTFISPCVITRRVQMTMQKSFFSHEYRLDYLIHNYPKPIIC